MRNALTQCELPIHKKETNSLLQTGESLQALRIFQGSVREDYEETIRAFGSAVGCYGIESWAGYLG
jgi:hypothetical protein